MRPLKFMITGATLILLGPIMTANDVWFSGFCVVCWLIGVPLLIAGLLMPEKYVPAPSDDLPQKQCPACGKSHDFDYPRCPYCGYDYSATK